MTPVRIGYNQCMGMAPDLLEELNAISDRAFMDEARAMEALLARVKPLQALEPAIMARAVNWTNTIREGGLTHGVEAFLHAYSLDTREGVALMCLAEALLRIPDADTADQLIQGTFEGKHWEDYVGNSDSWFLTASSWGLLLTGKVVDFGTDARGGMLGIFKNLVSKMGEPVIREALKKAMKLIGAQFVLGETLKDALDNSKSYLKQNYRFSYDILGEGARSDKQAMGYVNAYMTGLQTIGKTIPKDTPLFEAPGISVKLSALHPRYSLLKEERVLTELLPRLKDILLEAKKWNIAVSIDAEEAGRLDIELILFEALLQDPSFAGWNGIGFVVQGYQKRAFYVIDFLHKLAEKYQRVLPVRLVKGAYWDSEIKWAQVAGLSSYPVFTRKEHTDVSYLACADKILSYKQSFYPQFATHNARTMASIMVLAEHYSVAHKDYEFQRLHGMGEALHDITSKQVATRIYAPVGAHKDLLAYLIRRLLENGANSSFVHLLMDHAKSPEEILADPVIKTLKYGTLFNESLPLPKQLYGDARMNSSGMDFGNLTQVNALKSALGKLANHKWRAEPLTAKNAGAIKGPRVLTSPQNNSKSVGEVSEGTEEWVKTAVQSGWEAFPAWAAMPVEKRALILEKIADELEDNAAELIALCVHEAGKTLNDGIAEVREAADFCRYYAAEARRIMSPHPLTSPTGESNTLQLHPRGVFACISPWNFPLAIFTGQVTAALATGNCVIAKPAAQTPLIAYRAVQIMHEAGVPKAVLQLIPGGGSVVGAAMVAHPEISGVVFTGSVETAHHINHTLSQRKGAIVPFIAETGGQNCMVVDSSALLEQAVDDVILSAFGSAGQRCSALRVLFVQEDIADELIELLKGAMQELALGEPATPSTDVGPVIDASAKKTLLDHIERMKKEARFVAAVPATDAVLASGHFVPPHAFELRGIEQLTQEVFGPVLHIIRFKANEREKVAQAINSTGFGLTFGMHSRVDENVQFFINRVHAGNLYINRSMIGATVGVQPFGGEGLSGTGPKAGGPHYMLRFVTERTVTINTAAIGGNVALLAS